MSHQYDIRIELDSNRWWTWKLWHRRLTDEEDSGLTLIRQGSSPSLALASIDVTSAILWHEETSS